MYSSMLICMYAYTHIRMYVCMCVRRYINKHCTYTLIFVYIYICTNTFMVICMYACISKHGFRHAFRHITVSASLIDFVHRCKKAKVCPGIIIL